MGITKFLGILILTIAFFFSNLCVQAQTVRVGISNQSFSALDYSDITLFALSTVYVYDKDTNKELLKLDRETNFQITLKDGKYSISTDELKKPIKNDGNLLVVSPTSPKMLFSVPITWLTVRPFNSICLDLYLLYIIYQ